MGKGEKERGKEEGRERDGDKSTGLAVGIGCSSKRPRYNILHSYGSSQLSIIPVPGSRKPFFQFP